MGKLKYGERDEMGDVLTSIIGGGLSGYGQAQARSNEMKDALMKAILLEGIKQKIMERSMPDWVKTGVTPKGYETKSTYKTPYGSVSLIPKGGEQPIVSASGKIVGYRPKGAVFQPKGSGEDMSFLEGRVQPMAQSVTRSADRVRVKHISSGAMGTIEAGEFDPSIYEKI